MVGLTSKVVAEYVFLSQAIHTEDLDCFDSLATRPNGDPPIHWIFHF